MVVHSNKRLADYFHTFLQTAASFSYSLNSSSTPSSLSFSWPASNNCPPPLEDPVGFRTSASSLVQIFATSWAKKSAEIVPSSSTTTIQPFFQMGPLGVQQETRIVVPALLNAADDPDSTLDWTSGYFSLDRSNIARLLASKARVRVVCAAPEVCCKFPWWYSPALTKGSS